MIYEEHLRRELPPEKYSSCCGISSETADHLPLCWLWPISISSRIGLLWWQAQCSRNVRCSEYSRSIINSESELQRTRRSLGSHGVVELKHHPGIVELSRCHERQQGVMCNQSHGVSEPRVSGQCWHVVI